MRTAPVPYRDTTRGLLAFSRRHRSKTTGEDHVLEITPRVPSVSRWRTTICVRQYSCRCSRYWPNRVIPERLRSLELNASHLWLTFRRQVPKSGPDGLPTQSVLPESRTEVRGGKYPWEANSTPSGCACQEGTAIYCILLANISKCQWNGAKSAPEEDRPRKPEGFRMYGDSATAG